MIEKILRKSAETFDYGEVTAVNTIDRKVYVRFGEGSAWIKTELDLEIGNTVILARSADSSKFIVQYSRKVLPAEEVLLLI